jgi:hypothetical protein
MSLTEKNSFTKQTVLLSNIGGILSKEESLALYRSTHYLLERWKGYNFDYIVEQTIHEFFGLLNELFDKHKISENDCENCPYLRDFKNRLPLREENVHLRNALTKLQYTLQQEKRKTERFFKSQVGIKNVEF